MGEQVFAKKRLYFKANLLDSRSLRRFERAIAKRKGLRGRRGENPGAYHAPRDQRGKFDHLALQGQPIRTKEVKTRESSQRSGKRNTAKEDRTEAQGTTGQLAAGSGLFREEGTLSEVHFRQ